MVAPRSIDQSITFPGAGPGGNGTVVIFDPKQYEERDALLLSNGVVYTGWASHSDVAPYTGWLIGFNASNLGVASVLNVDPNGSPKSSFLDDGSGSSFWNSGGGPAADAAGNIYNLSANGPFDQTLNAAGFPANGDYGDSYLKFTPTAGGLTVSDYFTVYNQQDDANDDADIGSSGVTLVNVVDASGIAAPAHDRLGQGRQHLRRRHRQHGQVQPDRQQHLPGDPGGRRRGRVRLARLVQRPGLLRRRGRHAPRLHVRQRQARRPRPPRSRPTPSATPGPRRASPPTARPTGSPGRSATSTARRCSTPTTPTTWAIMLYNSDQAANGRDDAGPDNKFITPVDRQRPGLRRRRPMAWPSTGSWRPPARRRPRSASPRASTGPGSSPTARRSPAAGSTATARLSSALLGPSVTAAGVTFDLGPVGSNDVVSARARSSPCPRARSARWPCWPPASTATRPTRPSSSPTPTGPRQTFTQSISDWVTPQGYAGESTAATTAYRDTPTGGQQAADLPLYDYFAAETPPRQVRSLTLPADANVEVLAAALVPSATTQVALGGSFNRTGIVADGSTFSGGLDGYGTAFSANLIGPTVTAGGITFNLGPAGANDVVAAAGQVDRPARRALSDPEPAGHRRQRQPGRPALRRHLHRRLDVDVHPVDQRLVHPAGLRRRVDRRGDPVPRHRDRGPAGRRTFRVYEYAFALDPTRTVQSLTLPTDANVEVLGIDLNS